MSDFGLVIFDLTATAKKHEFFAAEHKKKNRPVATQEHERVAAQYRKTIEILRNV